MVQYKKHIIAWCLLVLVSIYVAPIQYLHNCHRQDHHEQTAHIEETHAECALCDIQLQSFDDFEPNYSIPNKFEYSTLSNAVATNYSFKFFELMDNKGPPAV